MTGVQTCALPIYGRQLGIIPGEDSFRKLTNEELAEEQDEAEGFDMTM